MSPAQRTMAFPYPFSFNTPLSATPSPDRPTSARGPSLSPRACRHSHKEVYGLVSSRLQERARSPSPKPPAPGIAAEAQTCPVTQPPAE